METEASMEPSTVIDPVTTSISKIKPFIKIPGGKRKLSQELLSYFPSDFFEKQGTYVEPFFGGGAVALEVIKKFTAAGVQQSDLSPRVLVNDFNPHLSNLWNMVIEDSSLVLEKFNEHIRKHSEDYFYEVRSSLEPIQTDGTSQVFVDPFQTAADFLYLDKNCFNGLIRYNKKGEFNSPIGKFPKPQTIDASNLLNLQLGLKGLYVYDKDFVDFVQTLMAGQDLTENTLVYFDPPYVPLTETSSFTDYTSRGFTEDDQLRLKGLVDRLTRMNVKVILSNSYTSWVTNEYSDYNINSIQAGRSINSVGKSRGKIKELVITNF